MNRNQPKPTELEIEIIEIVTQADAEYFKAHRTATEYQRAYVPGEVPRVMLQLGIVCIVRKIGPKVRSREFVEPAKRFVN